MRGTQVALVVMVVVAHAQLTLSSSAGATGHGPLLAVISWPVRSSTCHCTATLSEIIPYLDICKGREKERTRPPVVVYLLYSARARGRVRIVCGGCVYVGVCVCRCVCVSVYLRPEP